MVDDGYRARQERDVLNQPSANPWMRAHDLPLLRAERPRLEEDSVRDPDLAQVVDGRRLGDELDEVVRQAELLPEQAGIGRHTLRVMVRGGIPVIDALGQRAKRAARLVLELADMSEGATDEDRRQRQRAGPNWLDGPDERNHAPDHGRAGFGERRTPRVGSQQEADRSTRGEGDDRAHQKGAEYVVAH